MVYTKKKSRQYPAETMTDTDYADDLLLLAPANAESLLHNIGLHINANKKEYMWFKQEGTISTLSGRPLKFMDKFTYLNSNISSTERDVNIHIKYMICKHVLLKTFLNEPSSFFFSHTWFQVLFCNSNNFTSVIFLHIV